MDDGRRGYIYHTAVLEKHQHQGIGEKLLNEGIRSLKDLGIHKVSLVAFKDNEVGNAFWEKQGFKLRDDLFYRDKIIE